MNLCLSWFGFVCVVWLVYFALLRFVIAVVCRLVVCGLEWLFDCGGFLVAIYAWFCVGFWSTAIVRVFCVLLARFLAIALFLDGLSFLWF